MSTHSAGRRAAVKAGSKPVHFSLDGCPLFRYFSGSVATLRDTLSTSRSVGRGTGAFIYLPPFSENSPIFCSFPFAKIQSVFLPEQTGRMKHRTSFSPSATPAGITHYTLQAKSCAKGVPPFGNPRQQNRLNTSHFPVLDVQPLFVVSSPFHGLPFVPLSIVFPYTCRLADNHVRNATYLLVSTKNQKILKSQRTFPGCLPAASSDFSSGGLCLEFVV